jgi:hypothetical protein
LDLQANDGTKIKLFWGSVFSEKQTNETRGKAGENTLDKSNEKSSINWHSIGKIIERSI